MTKTLVALIVTIATTSQISFAQTLTDQEIAAAIQRGQRAKINDLGVEIKEGVFSELTNWRKSAGNAVAGMFNPLEGINANDFWKEFRGRLHTPASYIAYRAAESKRLGTKFGIAQVTTEDRRQVIRFTYAANLGYITDVVIRKNEKDGEGVPGKCVTGLSDEVLRHIPNTKSMCGSFEFSLAEVQHLLNDEFVITLHASDGQNTEVKNFTVKKKDLNKLPM